MSDSPDSSHSPSQDQTGPSTLDQVAPGESAVITSFLSDDPAFLRFRELGLLSGTLVQVIRHAPLGDPIEVSVRGTLLSIRAHEAREISVEPAALA